MRRSLVTLATLALVWTLPQGASAAERCQIDRAPQGRTVYQEPIGPHPSFLSVDADPSGAVEVYYGYNQPGTYRPLLVGARADGSGARFYLVSERRGTVPEPNADLDVKAGPSPSACVAVPAAGVFQRL